MKLLTTKQWMKQNKIKNGPHAYYLCNWCANSATFDEENFLPMSLFDTGCGMCNAQQADNEISSPHHSPCWCETHSTGLTEEDKYSNTTFCGIRYNTTEMVDIKQKYRNDAPTCLKCYTVVFDN